MEMGIRGFRSLALPVFLGLLGSLAVGGCQQTGASQVAEAPAPPPLPMMQGPKRTIAVGKFDAIGAFTAKYGGWDIGGGLAAMLTTALVKSDRFVVMERAQLSKILSEQELKASGLVNPETGPALGNLTGVQFLVYGSVTEFGAQDRGGGISLGVMGGGRNPLSLGGAMQSASGRVAMDLRIVDTTTGEVIESLTVAENIESSGFSLAGGYGGISLGGNQFDKTPLGQATRGAINRAVFAIASAARNQQWTGLVVDVDGADLYINAGARSGVKVGDMFMVERVTKTFTDPATGQVLGTRRQELGVLMLSGVQEKMAFGSYSPLEAESPPRRGDLVVVISK